MGIVLKKYGDMVYTDKNQRKTETWKLNCMFLLLYYDDQCAKNFAFDYKREILLILEQVMSKPFKINPIFVSWFDTKF